MLPVLSALCAALSAWLWLSPRTPAERLARLRPQPSPTHPVSEYGPAHPPAPDPAWPAPGNRRPTKRSIVPAAGTGLLAAVLVGGMPGLIAGVFVTPAVALYLHRKTPPHSHDDQRRITADLPFAADLMTACLRAGRPVSAATEIAATAIGGPLGERLMWVSTQLRLGADPEPTWAHLAKEPSMGNLSRAMSRAAQSGAPVADVLTRLADDAREASRAASVAAARKVGVKAVAPLGLCFLPAFVLLGIIPVVAGLASTIVLP